MINPDFEYISDGMFVSVLANTAQAASELGKFMAANGGSNKVLAFQLPAFKADLARAGYSIRKAKPISKAMADAILDELSNELCDVAANLEGLDS